MDRPILFSGPMVRAILGGTKTETRRLVTRATSTCGSAPWSWLRFDEAYPTRTGATLLVPGDHPDNPRDDAVHRVRPRWHEYDRLWVRETWRKEREHYEYRATERSEVRACAPIWRPSIYMPRAASRITLLVEAVRVERLQALTFAGAVAEGIADAPLAVETYAELWDTINGARAPWASNPWVWVLAFRRERP